MSIQYVHLEVDVRNHSSPVVRSRQKMHNAHTAHVLRQRATSPRNFNGWNGNPPITNYRVKKKENSKEAESWRGARMSPEGKFQK